MKYAKIPVFERGFALVVTLALMMLLALVAVGLLSLATITTRSSQATAMSVARANARMALILAIGDLQKFTGPDQRITADGSRDSDATKKYWIGSWKTATPQGNTVVPVIQWNADSSLTDARNSGVTNDSLFQGWLVSGWPNPPADRVQLVGNGTVADTTQSVSVPLVSLSNKKGRTGGYGYWVGDNSTKASFGIPDYLTGSQPTTPGDNGFVRLQTPQNTGLELVDGFETYNQIPADNLAKVTDYKQSLLAGSIGADNFKTKYHAVAGNSYTVLSDSLRSGLKRDLSIYFENGSAVSRGTLLPSINDNTPLLPAAKRSAHGPKLGVLRQWAKLSESRSTDGSLSPRASTSVVSLGYSSGGALPFAKLPDMSKPNAPVGPVMASVQYYTRFSYYRGYLIVNLYPRIVLWNPYNAKLSAAAYSMDVNFALSDDGKINYPAPDPNDPTKTITKTSGNYDYSPRGNKNLRMRLNFEATPFEPGEALVFTPALTASAIGGNSVPLALRNGAGDNLMSAKSNPANFNNFYYSLASISGLGITTANLPLPFNHNDGNYYWIDWMDWWEANPVNGMKASLHLGYASNYTNLMNLPVLQMVDMDNWKRSYGGRFNPGRWRVGGNEPIYDYETTASLNPWNRSAYGFRMKWPVESNAANVSSTPAQRFWEAGVQSDFNLRAPFCFRSPYDNVCDNGESHHWYMWGPYTNEASPGPEYNSAALKTFKSTTGYYRASPFFDASNASVNHVYPKYDLPLADERITSVGRFQHAALTPFVWHAAYAIGSSWVPSNVKDRSRSADNSTTVTGQWSSEVRFLPAWYRQNSPVDEIQVYDLAYEANHELWDAYYLSGSVVSERSSFVSQPLTNRLPNSRIVPRNDARIDTTRLNDYYQSASQVMLAGGFNVNSTDENAWKAVLGSMRDLTLPVQRGSSGGIDGTPFSRFFNPVTGPTAPPASKPMYAAESWSGYRKLTDAELTQLTAQVVAQVKTRGPFLSVSDFVNRRLYSTTNSLAEQGLMGALQQAIENTTLNQPLKSGDSTMRFTGWEKNSYELGNNAAAWSEKTHLRSSKGPGMATYLNQGDILQSIGGTLTARGDTFTVRTYGDARDSVNNIIATDGARRSSSARPIISIPPMPPRLPPIPVPVPRTPI